MRESEPHSYRDAAPKHSPKENGKLWSPAVLWDLEQILALLSDAAAKWTDRILTVHIGRCSHEEQEP